MLLPTTMQDVWPPFPTCRRQASRSSCGLRVRARAASSRMTAARGGWHNGPLGMAPLLGSGRRGSMDRLKVPTGEGEEQEERRDVLDGWPIRLTSFRSGDRFVCKIDNIDPGTLLSRGEGRT